jgi:hypothetical protein
VVFVSGLLLGVASLGHALAGARSVYGVYTPIGWAPAQPLINANTRAGYLNLAFFCGLAALVGARRGPLRWLIALGCAALLAASLSCASRGGTAAIALGLLGGGTLLGLSLRRRAATRTRFAALLACAVAAAIALVLLGWGPERSRALFDESTAKLDLWRRVGRLVADHFSFGVGRGAFEGVFAAYSGSSGTVFSHAECWPLDWAAGWGVPVALAAAIGFAAACWPILRALPRSPALLAVALGIVVLLLQNLADLALETAAVAATVCALLGALSSQARVPSAVPPKRAPALALAAAAALGSMLALGWGANPAVVERGELGALFARSRLQEPATRDALDRRIRDAVRRHPADAYFYLLGALTSEHRPGGRPLAWINRALQRNIASGRAHLALAGMLRRRGALRQAMLELRLAVENDLEMARPAARAAESWTSDEALLLLAVPAGPRGAWMLHALAMQARTAALRRRLFAAALERDPDHTKSHRDAALDLLAALRDARDASCSGELRTGCLARAGQHAARLEALAPGSSHALAVRARVLGATGRHREAVRLLAERCPSDEAAVQCLEARVALSAEGAPEGVQDALAAYLRVRCAEDGSCAEAETWAGDLLLGLGHKAEALVHYERAARISGAGPAWARVAVLAAELGDSIRAVRAARRAAQAGTKIDAELQRRIESEAMLPAATP